jgi:deoxycytidine triphosphate deaminase
MGSTGAPPAAWQGPGIEEVQTAANPLISGRCVFRLAEPALCIVPPNGFALARTLEYFRIPRNVLTICLGTST